MRSSGCFPPTSPDLSQLVQEGPPRAFRARSQPGGLALAVLLALVAAGIAAALVHRRAPTYDSRTTILIDGRARVDTTSNAESLITLSLFRSKYEALAKTAAIAVPVARQLGVDERRVADNVSASEPPASFVFTIVGSSRDAEFARRLSQAVATELSLYADREQQAVGLQPQARYQLRLLAPASAASRESTRSDTAKVAGAVAVLTFIVADELLRLRRA
jgi:hypothetical protein